MRSLFEEQIRREQLATFIHTEPHGESFAEALCYFPRPEAFALGPEDYLEHLRRVKEAVHVPVIASLNGTTLGGWLEYAGAIEQAGADALELNVYAVPCSADEDAAAIETRTVRAAEGAQGRGADPGGREAVAVLHVAAESARGSSSRRGPTASSCSTASTSRTSTSRA